MNETGRSSNSCAEAVPSLIERLEKAAGPDREIDAEIMHAAFNADVWSYDDNSHIDAQIQKGIWRGSKEEHPDYEESPVIAWRFRRGGPPGTDPSAEYGELPAYTASVDAALTLVPKGAGIRLDRYWLRDREAWMVCLSTGGVPSNPLQAFCSEDAHTAPLALCIAALKARGLSDAGSDVQADAVTVS